MFIEVCFESETPMGQELSDCRTKVSKLAQRVIKSKSMARGCTDAEIVREVLEAWARQEDQAATVLHRLRRGEGGIGEDEGRRGQGGD